MRISSRKKYQIPLSTDHTNYESYPGNRVPSVTTVLKVIGKESLMQWANSLGWKRKSLTKELNDASVIYHLHIIISKVSSLTEDRKDIISTLR